MSTDQLVALSAFLIIFLLGLVGWFVRKLVQDLEKKVEETGEKVKDLEKSFANWRLTAEQNFVNFDTHQSVTERFTKNFEKIFDSLAESGKILARLEERSRGEDRMSMVLKVIEENTRRGRK